MTNYVITGKAGSGKDTAAEMFSKETQLQSGNRAILQQEQYYSLALWYYRTTPEVKNNYRAYNRWS